MSESDYPQLRSVLLSVDSDALLQLCQVSTTTKAICNDDSFWQERLLKELDPNLIANLNKDLNPESPTPYKDLYFKKMGPHLIVDPNIDNQISLDTEHMYKQISRGMGFYITLTTDNRGYYIKLTDTGAHTQMLSINPPGIKQLSNDLILSQSGMVYRVNLEGYAIPVSWYPQVLIYLNAPYVLGENNQLFLHKPDTQNYMEHLSPIDIPQIPNSLIKIDNRGKLGIDEHGGVWNLESGDQYPELQNIVQVLSTTTSEPDFPEDWRQQIEHTRRQYDDFYIVPKEYMESLPKVNYNHMFALDSNGKLWANHDQGEFHQVNYPNGMRKITKIYIGSNEYSHRPGYQLKELYMLNDQHTLYVGLILYEPYLDIYWYNVPEVFRGGRVWDAPISDSYDRLFKAYIGKINQYWSQFKKELDGGKVSKTQVVDTDFLEIP